MGCSPLVQQEKTHGSQQMAAIPTVASVRPISSVPRDCWPEATLAPCLVGLSIQSLPYKHHLCPQGQLKRTPALRCPLYNPSWWVKHGDTSTKGLVTFYPRQEKTEINTGTRPLSPFCIVQDPSLWNDTAHSEWVFPPQ